ncbi:hypothetical protein OROHE_027508 [Orobanche hederae]
MTAAKHSATPSSLRPLLSEHQPSGSLRPPQYVVFLPPHLPPYRGNRLLRKSCQRRLICSAVLLLILGAAAYVLWPSDPKLSVVRLSLDRLHFHTTPKISVDVTLDLTIKVWNKDFYSIDYDSMNVAIGYRGRRLGFMSSDGGRIRARHSSYVNATLQLDGAEVLSDAILLIEDLARGEITFDTETAISGKLGLFFFDLPLKTEKLVHAASKGSKVRFGTWNVGSLTGRAAEVGEVMKRRRIHIMCLQETKWVGEKARVLAPWGYKLWYSGKDRSRNGVGIVIDKEMIDDVVEVSRKSDRIMSIRLVIGDEFLTIISAYAPQVGLDASIKQEFWEDLEEVVERIPMSEKLIIGGDLNGHVGVSRDGFESVHGGFGFGDRNEAGNGILDFALAYDLGIMNTWFEKRDSHLVTYRNGGSASQIDFFLVRNGWRKSFTNCKVIPGESAATQHRVVVLDLRGKRHLRKRRPQVDPRIKWWKLQGESRDTFVAKIADNGMWSDCTNMDIDSMWNLLEYNIKEVAKEVLREFKGNGPSSKDTFWWNEEVKQAIKTKREYRT